MENSLASKWESERQLFVELSKTDFDELARSKQFVRGPIVQKPSKWIRGFGPYSPRRWALGKLIDGRFVCCDVAAEAEGEEPVVKHRVSYDPSPEASERMKKNCKGSERSRESKVVFHGPLPVNKAAKAEGEDDG